MPTDTPAPDTTAPDTPNPEYPSVVVLCGGLSAERDVSLRSGRRLAEALRSLGFPVRTYDVDAGLLPALREDRPDCVVPMLHGAAGEDGALRDLLDSLHLPYVGSLPAACRLAFDKPIAKALVAHEGVRTPESMALPHATFRELGAAGVMAAVIDRIGLPLVVKPTKGGSALGTSIVHEAAELPRAMVGAFAYGETALIEQYIAGTEVAASVVDAGESLRALPLVEIVPDGGIYDYNARYTAGLTEFFAPARLSPQSRAEAGDMALTVHRVLGLRDFSRIDMIVDDEGLPWFLEVAVAPGMTETSLLPQALLADDSDLAHLMADLVRRCVARNSAPGTGSAGAAGSSPS